MKLVKYYGHLEALNESELAYLQKTADSNFASFKKMTHYIFLVLAILMLFIYTIANFTYNPKTVDPLATTPLTPGFVLQVGVIMFVLFAIILFIAYFLTIAKLFKEIKQGHKVVEVTTIKEKKHMPQNNTYYLFLNSPTRNSIEVEQSFFDAIDINDEINIEYAPLSKNFLGYY